MASAEMRKHVIEKTMFDDEMTVWERALSVDLLVLDDLGKGTEDAKGFGERALDELIRTRSAGMRATIVTTNMTLTQLTEALKTSTVAAMRETVVPIQVCGEDRRAAAAQTALRMLE